MAVAIYQARCVFSSLKTVKARLNFRLLVDTLLGVGSTLRLAISTILTFSSGQILGWTGLIRVDGKPYVWMGAPPGMPLATQTSFEYTSTQSIFTMNIDSKIGMTVTFLSPVAPDDLKRQSLVFSYLNVEVHSLDGKPHDVQIYSDISAGE